MKKAVIIIGAGPAGCMAAISTKKHYPDSQVTLIDSNNRLGVKMRLSGGGRCNLSANVSNEEIINHTPKNGRFLYSSLAEFNPQSIIHFFNERSLKLKEEDHHRLFPITNKAVDVVAVLEKEMKSLGVDFLLNNKVLAIDEKSKTISTLNQSISFDACIISTGGQTFSHTGSDGSGFNLLKSLGHHITDLKPAEVALVSNDACIQSKELQGLSFKDIKITSFKDKKKVKTVENDLLITHFGLSGPAALQTSSYLSDAFDGNHQITVKIDFCPKLSLESLQQDKDLMDTLKKNQIPKRLIQYLENNTPKNQIANTIKAFDLTIHNTRGFSSAFVTAGGLSLKEVNPKTMKSKIHPWLSICGETLDINSLTGGYNITIALSTGFVAGKYIFEDI